MKRYFTFKDDKSDKFWSIETSENKVIVLFGKTGTAGVANEKDFDSPESAQKEAENLIREKVKKGYVEQNTPDAGLSGEAEFWNLIERAKKESGGDGDLQAQLLTEALAKRSVEDILAFDRIFDHFHCKSYQSRLWAAAYIINCGCSNDGFDYFRAWLIGEGKDVFEKTLEDPEYLARHIKEEYVGQSYENELLMSAALDAFMIKTGKDLDAFYDLAGEHRQTFPDIKLDWDEEQVDSMFPKLAKKFSEGF